MKETSVRLRVLLGLAVGALMSCGQPDSALRVRVTVRSQGGATVRADYLRLAVLDDSQELKAVTFSRDNSDEALVGVRRGKSHVSTIKL